MKVAIYQKEDNYNVLKYLEECQKHFSFDHIEIYTYSNYKDFIRDFIGWEFDLIYIDLDYHGDLDGVTLAKNIYSLKKTCLITVLSNSTQYINDAFLIHAFQYLIAPFSKKLFIDEFLRAICYQMDHEFTYVFPTTKGSAVVKSSNIVYLSTSYREYKLCTLDAIHYGSSKSILGMKNSLLDKNFFKIERSTIINLAYVKSYDTNCVEMINEETFVLSKMNYKMFKEKLTAYLNYRNGKLL